MDRTEKTTSTTARWACLLAEIPIGLEDEVAFSLGRDSLGVEVIPSAPERSTIRVYWAAVEDRDVPIAAASAALRAFGLDPAACALRVEPIEDGKWVERYEATLEPIPLGERFVVIPGRDIVDLAGRIPLRIVPGMAFGTGEHPTTRQCAAALERLVEQGSAWLDLGCGTGILGMVAHRLGAAEVVAIDVDPAAVVVAREAAALNGFESGLEFREGSIGDVETGRYYGIVANIASSFFLRRASEIAQALRDGGLLVASGFLVEDLPEIRASLSAAGVRVREEGNEGPWALVIAAKTGR